jgi:hypothetical protein
MLIARSRYGSAVPDKLEPEHLDAFKRALLVGGTRT